ncbi:MAG: succinate dehydrogenase, cytochrome b556 subunit [Gammaproteobacteria bacterium]|nr:succinate dehydrogenase, cytochrome b556 subunit [Gammaproteobacteria bacterium]
MHAEMRPLSPHLQVYRPQLTSVLSIMHRATGLVLAAGSIVLVYWLLAAASGAEAYATAHSLLASWAGRVIMLGITFSLFYHLCNGIRHLFWDAGKGFELESVYASGWAVVITSVALTLLAWVVAYAMRGGS